MFFTSPNDTVPLPVTGLDRLAQGLDRHKLLIFFIPFLIYMINGREISSGDPTPSLFTAINLSKKGTIFLDDFHDYVAYHSIPFYLSEQRGHLVSNYPIFPGVMATPLVAPAAWAGLLPKGEGDLVWKYLAKLSGSIYTSLSVLFLYLTLRRLIDPGGAVVLAMAYGLGTALWPIASQSLWQHGPSVFWWTVCFYALLRGAREEETLPASARLARWLLLAGFAAGGAVLCRTVNGIGGAVLCLGILVHFRWRAAWFVAPYLALMALLLGYNLYIFGSWKGGDVVLHSLQWELDRIDTGAWATPLPVGLAGQLVSPSRGMFIFSPFLLFSIWGMVHLLRQKDRGGRLFAWTIPIPILMFLVFSKYSVWWGGNSHYGPRYQIETYPFLMLYLACLWPRLAGSRRWMTVFLVLLAFSIWVQWVGAFCYPSEWTVKPVPLWEDKGRFWDWRYNQIWSCAASGVKKPDLFLP